MRVFNLVLLIGLLACGQTETQQPDGPDLGAAEKRYLADPTDSAVARAYSADLDRWVRQHPEDSISPYHALKSILVRRSIRGDELDAIVALQKLSRRYAPHEVSVEAEFQAAFTWDEFIGHAEKAKQGYAEFIEKHPDHPRREMASALLRILCEERPLEDLVDQWKKQNTETTNP